MKSLFVASVLALVAVTAHAGEDSTDRWFGGEGLAWYEHPCGLRAFSKYGEYDTYDTPEARHAYELTKQHPELCAKVFP
jgi:hypothetical protein